MPPASVRGGAAGEAEVTSAFRAELEERDLLEVALAIVRPLHLRVDELQCKGAHASPALSAARKAFLGHLDGVGWSLWAMAKLLGYKSHASVSEVLGRKAPGKGKAVADPCAAGTGAWGVFPPGATKCPCGRPGCVSLPFEPGSEAAVEEMGKVIP